VVKRILKIGIIGPEATGKSALAEALALHYKTEFVPEFARSYLENLDTDYTENDLLEIANGQLAYEKTIVENANKYLFCDTTLHVIQVWSEVKYNRCDLKILNNLINKNYDLLLLCNIDLPWTYDKLREHPLEKDRQLLYKMYEEIVEESGIDYGIVHGLDDKRLKCAINIIDTKEFDLTQ
jgi:NadR type nicotinamide-nucleotide adenylyltransferase